jgi:ABC-type antimicrobial peptide transport system permease subunit
LRLVLGQGLQAVAVGLVLGLGGALVFARLLRTSNDFTSYTIACALLALAAILACWLPARRATRVNPSDALRAE